METGWGRMLPGHPTSMPAALSAMLATLTSVTGTRYRAAFALQSFSFRVMALQFDQHWTPGLQPSQLLLSSLSQGVAPSACESGGFISYRAVPAK
ncbi:hypothetical protein GDO78_015383 [Eleutherodactylus coqui]|uniref:Uncharacterized protein n=1 Tax=Eleutherodactylus coqui TaxID=57060 RepID=A0A8J6B764_ELECQ|nr:hypothetical protein GDO78_015383 [Eleutherodactylus coqui]